MRGWAAMLGLAVAACASPGNELALKAPETMVGMPKSELLGCAGVPQTTTAAGGVEDLIYSRRQTIVERDVDYDDAPWFGARGPVLRRPTVSTWSRSYTCEVTATVQNGRVSALRYNDQRDITLCYQILSACLPPPR